MNEPEGEKERTDGTAIRSKRVTRASFGKRKDNGVLDDKEERR